MMKRKTIRASNSPGNVASHLRGLYVRVATRLDLDPSYVSRVARGERKSKTVEIALRHELERILKLTNLSKK
ncbi:MAG: hypothetical protein ACRD4Y_11245 [Candidatus Acidiferrales bacterium]